MTTGKPIRLKVICVQQTFHLSCFQSRTNHTYYGTASLCDTGLRPVISPWQRSENGDHRNEGCKLDALFRSLKQVVFNERLWFFWLQCRTISLAMLDLNA